MHHLTVSALFVVALTAAIPVPPQAHAADSCQPVFDALTKVVTTPSHSYTTHTAAAVNGGKPRSSETIDAEGKVYMRVNGKWMHSPVSPAEVLDQEKEKREQNKSTCQFLRNESVNGEAAMLFSMHREYEEVKEDAQMWVSRGTGLLLRVEEDVDNRGNKIKEHRSTRFEYGNIRPPS